MSDWNSSIQGFSGAPDSTGDIKGLCPAKVEEPRTKERREVRTMSRIGSHISVLLLTGVLGITTVPQGAYDSSTHGDQTTVYDPSDDIHPIGSPPCPLPQV